MAHDDEIHALLLRHGRYSPPAWLEAQGWLDSDAHQRWRSGRLASLEQALRAPPATLKRPLQRAAARAQAMGLSARAVVDGAPMRWSSDPELAALLATEYVREERAGQLDLFADNALTQAVNAATRALAEQREADARQAIAHLAAEWPEHQDLDWLVRLGEILGERGPPISDPVRELDELDHELEPQALRLLGPGGTILIARRWRALGAAFGARAYDPAAPRRHASYAHLRAADWDAVRAAVLAEPDWPAQPVLLLRLALAERYTGCDDEALTAALALASRHPEAFADAVDQGALPDPFLRACWERFQDEPEELPAEALAAWSVLHTPGLARRLPKGPAAELLTADPAFSRARDLALAASGGGSPGRAELEARRVLNEHDPALLRVWQARGNRARSAG